jgi:large subunit ribosomal protein L23
MALFQKDTKKEKEVKNSLKNKKEDNKKTSSKNNVEKNKIKKPRGASAGSTLSKTPVRILKKPRITEKAAKMTLHNAYVFEVFQDATKRDINAVIKALYGVEPKKINIVSTAPRTYISRARNRRGIKSGMKKAYVFLKKGDKIDLSA